MVVGVIMSCPIALVTFWNLGVNLKQPQSTCNYPASTDSTELAPLESIVVTLISLNWALLYEI